MKLSGFCFYILALLFEGDRKEEGAHTRTYSSLQSFLSFFCCSSFGTEKNKPSLRTIDYEKPDPVTNTFTLSNENFPVLMLQNGDKTASPDPETPYHSDTTNWIAQQILLLWRRIDNIQVEIITVFALALILIGIIQMLKILTRFKTREEEIMLHNIEKSFLELNNSMIKASENITSMTNAFVRERMKQSDEKYSELLTKLIEALQLQNMRTEEREAKSCYLIMKFRSARLLQYGQLNMYLESLLEHLMKQQSELTAFHDSIFDIRSFAVGISTQFSESRVNAHRFIKEILQSIQNNALFEENQEKSADNLMNMMYILEPIVKKTSNNFNLRTFNGFK